MSDALTPVPQTWLALRHTWVALIVCSCLPTKRNPDYCASDLPCEDGRVCDVAHNACVDSIDGAPGAPDAPPEPVDAVDADTSRAVVSTYQAADLVLGQSGFTAGADQGCSASTAYASGVAADNGALYVAEENHNRILAWVPIPTATVAANRVLGDGNFTSCPTSPTGTGAHNLAMRFSHIAAGGNKFLTAGRDQNKVLVWSPAPSASSVDATLVIGQSGFSMTGSGNGAAQMRSPRGVWTDGVRVVVADTGNHRVLIWTTFPTSSGVSANLVLGQSGFGIGDGTPPATPSSTNMNSPGGVWSDGTRLVVADTGHNRVLIWTTFPTSNGEAADVVLGQASFTTKAAGLSADGMNGPTSVTGTTDALFVSDTANDRVLVFSPFPTTTTAAAFVLGQPDLDTGANSPAATSQSLDEPRQVTVLDDKLWIADYAHHRALRFTLYP